MLCYTRICYVYYKSLQAEAVTKPRTFDDACAHPSAKRLVVRGRTGPVNAVEADGALFIENDEAEAEAIPSDAATVVATALDAAATSDAGSIAFEGIASASASSFSMKRAPSASTALTGPVRPRTTRHLALGWVHASAKVHGLVTASACNDL